MSVILRDSSAVKEINVLIENLNCLRNVELERILCSQIGLSI